MADFMIRFLICNVFISGIIGILLIAKRIFKSNLSSRMQYNLWFLLLGLLAVPFIPFRLIGFPQIISWINSLRISSTSNTGTAMEEVIETNPFRNANWMNDFTLSANSETPSIAGYILLGIWIVGILTMIILVIKSSLRLHSLEKSALPLQNKEVRRLYNHCLEEMGIHRDIPVYSTAFLKSPIIVGLLKPCIYLPIHLISDYNEPDMRYMLLHELQHYRHHDAIASYLMNLAGVVCSMYSTRSSSGVFHVFSFVANIPATHTAEITAAIPIAAIAIHRSLLLVFFLLFLLFPFFILTSIHFAFLIWSYSIFNVRYILKILHL